MPFYCNNSHFQKNQEIFQKILLFFRFRKKKYLEYWKVIEIDSGDKNRLSEGARVEKLTKFGFFGILRGF